MLLLIYEEIYLREYISILMVLFLLFCHLKFHKLLFKANHSHQNELHIVSYMLNLKLIMNESYLIQKSQNHIFLTHFQRLPYLAKISSLSYPFVMFKNLDLNLFLYSFLIFQNDELTIVQNLLKMINIFQNNHIFLLIKI